MIIILDAEKGTESYSRSTHAMSYGMNRLAIPLGDIFYSSDALIKIHAEPVGWRKVPFGKLGQSQSIIWGVFR